MRDLRGRAAAASILQTLVLSAVVLVLLIAQAAASFRAVPRLGPWPSWYFWPFLDYPMYSEAHYEGDAIEQYVVFATFDDGTEAPVRREELGLSFWKFRDGLVYALRHGDRRQLDAYLELFRRRHARLPAALRLEDHPVVISRGGILPAPRKVLKTVTLGPGAPLDVEAGETEGR